MMERPAANGALQVTTSPEVASSVPDGDPVEAHLRRLVARCDDIPLLADLDGDMATPCAVAAIARAALRWHLDGQPEAVRERLLAEIEFNDRFSAWRMRALSHDLSGATDWVAASRRASWAELQRLRMYEPGMAS
jgi:hypothetical protein